MSARPPDDATRCEHARDATLAFLDRREFSWAAVAMVPFVLGFGATWFFLIIGVPAPLSEEERHWWQNTSIQILVTLMFYAAVVSLPWRLSNAVHLWCSRRSSGVGDDLYGRSTEEIWFHTPRRPRGVITVLQLGNCISQFINRASRCVYPDYESSSSMPGRFWTLAFLLLAFVLQGAAGVYKAVLEAQLRREQPGRFGPSPAERAARWCRGGSAPPDEAELAELPKTGTRATSSGRAIKGGGSWQYFRTSTVML